MQHIGLARQKRNSLFLGLEMNFSVSEINALRFLALNPTADEAESVLGVLDGQAKEVGLALMSCEPSTESNSLIVRTIKDWAIRYKT